MLKFLELTEINLFGVLYMSNVGKGDLLFIAGQELYHDLFGQIPPVFSYIEKACGEGRFSFTNAQK